MDETRASLLKLVQIGQLRLNLELMCPETGATLETFEVGDELPKFYSDPECGAGEEFAVQPSLIWVTFSPTSELQAESAAIRQQQSQPLPEGAPGKARASASLEVGAVNETVQAFLQARVKPGEPGLVYNDNRILIMSNDDNSRRISGHATVVEGSVAGTGITAVGGATQSVSDSPVAGRDVRQDAVAKEAEPADGRRFITVGIGLLAAVAIALLAGFAGLDLRIAGVALTITTVVTGSVDKALQKA